MHPLISIIVPVYNVEKYIDECLNSLLNQSYSNIEIILVDDGSKDNSASICDEYSKKYTNVCVIHKENGGLGFARNTGIDNCNGEYLLFIDSDDYVANNYVEVMFENLLNTHSDACMCGYTAFDGNVKNEVKNGLAGNEFSNSEITNKIIPMMCGRDKHGISVQMSACMVMYKYSIINENKIRFFSEREFISEDLLFNINYLSHCEKVVCTDITGYFYRYNPTSLTHVYLRDRFDKQKVMTSKVMEETKKLGIYDMCEDRIINTFLGWTRSCLKMEQMNCSENGFSQSIKNMKSIINDGYVRNLVSSKAIHRDKTGSVIINYLIKYKLTYFVYVVMKLKNKFGG